MFEGEERWSRNCGSGIGLSNYKNIYRDDILVGNWQEDLYGNRINPDNTTAVTAPRTICVLFSLLSRAAVPVFSRFLVLPV